MKKFAIILILCPVILLYSLNICTARDWTAEYDRLYQRIMERFSEPKEAKAPLEEYFHWMELKAADRDEAVRLDSEINRESFLHPEDKELAELSRKSYYLQWNAQASGDGTVNMAASIYLRWNAGIRGAEGWEDAIWIVRNYGRPLYNKAIETRFDTDHPKTRANCMIKFAIYDIEYGHLAIYSFESHQRKGFVGYYDEEGYERDWDFDYNTDCMARKYFTKTSEGRPRFPADRALGMVEQIREECDWWQFGDDRQDATDLMNEYYEDVLCKIPPHIEKHGHKWFRDIAEKYQLQKSINHNKGFYGTIYGKVEVKNNGGRKPAPGASVRVFSPQDKQEWKTNADANGKYRIKGVILHKDCSPFQISAEYQGDRVETSYTGPLTKPDNSYKYEKDLFIDKKRRPDTAILKGKYYYHRSTAKQKETKEIEATVRLKLKAFSADLCEVVSTEVISFSGKEEGFYDGEKRVDYQLVSASVWVPPSLGKATIGGITLKRDEKTKKVIAAQLPIIILDLEWAGCCDTTPTEKLTIGPVTKEDKEEKKRKRNEMRKMRRELRKDLSRLASALWGTFHKDFKVKTGDGINRFGGSGEDVKQRKSSITKSNYEWEIYLKKK